VHLQGEERRRRQVVVGEVAGGCQGGGERGGGAGAIVHKLQHDRPRLGVPVSRLVSGASSGRHEASIPGVTKSRTFPDWQQ
jgi:hypothetical protein